MAQRYEWGGVVCQGDEMRRRVHSWFASFVPASFGLPLKCDVQEEVETGREVAMRALYRRADGALMEAERRKNRRGLRLTVKRASPAILRGYQEAEPRPASDQPEEKEG